MCLAVVGTIMAQEAYSRPTTMEHWADMLTVCVGESRAWYVALIRATVETDADFTCPPCSRRESAIRPVGSHGSVAHVPVTHEPVSVEDSEPHADVVSYIDHVRSERQKADTERRIARQLRIRVKELRAQEN